MWDSIHNNNSCKEPVRMKTTSVALVSANDIDTVFGPRGTGPSWCLFSSSANRSVFPAQLSHLSSNLSINNLANLEQLGHITCCNYNQNSRDASAHLIVLWNQSTNTRRHIITHSGSQSSSLFWIYSSMNSNFWFYLTQFCFLSVFSFRQGIWAASCSVFGYKGKHLPQLQSVPQDVPHCKGH